MTDTFDRLKAALADRYAIERELGAGGMATVYLAEDLKHHRKVAVKVLRSEIAAALGPERFLREIEIAAQLQHPHILTLIDSGEADSFLYYVMPYVEGESLRAKLAREGELPINEALRVLREVVDALKHAHQHGLVHRDIKPDNVLLSDDHAVVTDFGVAKAVSEATGRQQLTTAGVALGTPAYMAPEQAAADPHVDHRADIYAVGVLAYEMLSGRPPFTGSTAQQVLSAHITETPESVATRRDTVPPALAELVMRCLQKKPADRWQSGDELLHQIDALMTPTGGTVPVTAALSRRGSKALWAVAAAMVIALGVLLFPRGSRTVDTDSNKLAIIPFAPVVSDTALTRLGRELVVLLSTSLDGVGELTTVLGSTILAQAGDADRTYSLDQGIELARALGAGKAIHANLVRQGANVRVEMVIASTENASQTRLTVVAPLDDIAAITDSVSWAILREIWQEDEPPSPRIGDKLGTRSIEALSAFLEGEQASVESRYRDAEDAYARAIAADSSFWLAYRRYAVARGWFNRSVPQQIRNAYLEHLDELPEVERRIIEATRNVPGSQVHDRLRAVVERFPEYWPAWMAYADRLLHWAPIQAGTTADDAQAALERTLELNPRFIPAWQHLEWMMMVRGDSAGAFAVLDTLEALDGARILSDAMGYDQFSELRILAHARFWGHSYAAPLDSLTDQLAKTRTRFAGYHTLASQWIGYFGSPALQIEWSRAIAEKTPMRDVAATHEQGIGFAWAGRGAWDSALTVMGRLASAGGTDAGLNAYRLAVAGAWLGAANTAVAGLQRADAVRDVGADYHKRVDLAWLDGILAVARADAGGLVRAREQLAADTGLVAARLERSLAAFESEMRGDRDSAARLMLELVREVRDIGGWGSSHPMELPVHRLAASRWLVAKGDAAIADSLLRWHEGLYALSGEEGWALNATMPIVLLERARLNAGLGRTDAARHFYEEFLRRFDMPDESLRHLVVEAERALARLDGIEDGRGERGR